MKKSLIKNSIRFFSFFIFSYHNNDLEIHSRHGLSAHNNGFLIFSHLNIDFRFL
eukprot:UN13841